MGDHLDFIFLGRSVYLLILFRLREISLVLIPMSFYPTLVPLCIPTGQEGVETCQPLPTLPRELLLLFLFDLSIYIISVIAGRVTV